MKTLFVCLILCLGIVHFTFSQGEAIASNGISNASTSDGKLVIETAEATKTNPALPIYNEVFPVSFNEAITIADPKVQFTVYPTKSKGEITIEAASGATYRIVSTQGKVLLSGRLQAVSEKIDITIVPAGYYYVLIEFESLSQRKTIVRQ